MKLYLSSYRVGDRSTELAALCSGRRIGLIPNAMDNVAPEPRAVSTMFGGSAAATSTHMGTYTFNDGAITLTAPADDFAISGSITGSTLTLTNEVGAVLIYEK